MFLHYITFDSEITLFNNTFTIRFSYIISVTFLTSLKQNHQQHPLPMHAVMADMRPSLFSGSKYSSVSERSHVMDPAEPISIDIWFAFELTHASPHSLCLKDAAPWNIISCVCAVVVVVLLREVMGTRRCVCVCVCVCYFCVSVFVCLRLCLFLCVCARAGH